MNHFFLVIAALNGFIAVSLGAFAAHGLKNSLSAELLTTFQTAVQYHMYHSLALFGIGLLTLTYPQNGALRVSGYLFLIGVLLFSGSLYLLSLTGVRWLGAITPLGGLAFLAGWGLMAWTLVRM